ncbi:MAG: TonB-dependent receptor [Sediminibacterium sp.]|nr:TonB-dependent receptor [Sediminibacterium sp.]
MKKIELIAIVFLITISTKAQNSIIGRIKDEKQKPLKAATILLLQAEDSVLVKSTLSNDKGEYKLADITQGKYLIHITSIGYQKYYETIAAVEGNSQIRDIQLKSEIAQLDEVTVVAKKPFLEQRADKMLVNIEGSATAAGSNALEILKKVPGVIIRNDKVSIAGRSNVMIMIDGKTSQYTDINLVLKDISADNISKIEVITNPGAKYDAAGGSIINILLKKKANLGTNGSITLSAGTGLYDNRKERLEKNFYRYSPDININHRKGKINLFGSYGYNHRNWFEYNEFDRIIEPNRYFQENIFYYKVNSHNYRFGMDFYANNKNTFGILIKGFNRDGGSEMINNTQQFTTGNNQLVNSFKTLNNINLSRNNISANVNWKHQFDSLGKELNVDIDFSKFNINNNSLITNNATSPNKTVYNQLVDNPVKLIVAKLDYTLPMIHDLQIDMGAKSSFANIDNYLTYLQSGVKDNDRSSEFLYKENINAAYTSISKKIDTWQLVAGLRTEQTVATGQSKGVTVLDRNYWQLFPSLFITKNMNKHFAAVTQYSRRIDRPSYQQQNPFVLVLDSLTFTKGNPLLKPQITDAYKFSITYDKQPFFAISYNKTKDVIFDNAPKQEGNKTFTTPENLAQYENLAFELNFPIQFGKKISGFGGNQAILNHYKADYLGTRFDKKAWNWLAYWQVAYKPVNTWKIEISGYYTTQFLTEFFTIGEQGSLGVAIQKSIADNKGKFTLNFNDILFSEKTRGNVVYQNINVNFRQWEESRNVRLSFSWSFGNQSLKAVRSRTTAGEAEKNRVKLK